MKNLTPQNKHDCPQCGTDNINRIVYSDTVDFRGMELDVEGMQESKCNHCHYKWTSAEQHNHNETTIRAAYSIIRDKLRTTSGLLLGKDIANKRRDLGLNQREAAVLFGGGYNAFNKYESGEVLQSFAMDRLLRLTSAIGQPAVIFLKNLFKPPVVVIISKNTNELGVSMTIGNTYISGSNIDTTGNSGVEEFFNTTSITEEIHYQHNPQN